MKKLIVLLLSALMIFALASCGGSSDTECTVHNDANGDGKMIAAMATQIPIRNFMAMSMGVASPEIIDGLLMILNDGQSSFKGLCKILVRIPGALTRLPALLKSI